MGSAATAGGCGGSHTSSTTTDETTASVEQGLTAAEDQYISAAWTQMGGAAIVGNPTANPADLPEQKGRYQTFAKGTIVWSGDEGAVLVPQPIFAYWVGLTSQKAAEDSTRTRFDYIGLPKNGSDSPSSTDTVAWDSSVHFERGIIGTTGGQVRSVEGHLYERFAVNPAQYGLPTGNAPHTTVPSLQYTWIGQSFANGEVWTRTDPTGGFTTVTLPHGAVFDYLANTSDCGDPLADITSVTGGGEVGRFSKGSVFAATSGGAHLVPNSPTASDGRSLASTYDELGGPTGWLGYPKGSGVSPGGASFTNFDGGVLAVYSDGTTGLFGTLTFSYDTAQDTYSSQVGFGPYWSTNYTVYRNGVDVYDGHAQDGAHNFSDDHETSINQTYPLTVDGNVHYSVFLQGVSSQNNDIGHVTRTYDIDNRWGATEDHRSSFDHMNFSTHAINAYPYDRSDRKGELWWSFHNFTTNELSYHTYARTFVDVSDNDNWLQWGNKLFYNVVYKGLSSGGNCFGMNILAIDSELGRAAWDEPIHQWFPDTQLGWSLTDASHVAQDSAHTNLEEDINVKHGYQLSDASVAWYIANLLPSETSTSAFTFASNAIVLGQKGVFSINSNQVGGDAHVIFPYALDTGACVWLSAASCARVKVLDPNLPSAKDAGQDFVEFSADLAVTPQWAYNPMNTYGAGAGKYTGQTYGIVPTGGRIMYMPYSPLFDHKPHTPVYGLADLLNATIFSVMGSSGSVAQVTDETGKTLFAQPVAGGKIPRWDDLSPASTRIPSMTPMPVGDMASGAQVYVGKGLQSTLRYDLQPSAGQPLSTPYETMFASGLMTTHFVVPGTPGVPDQVTLDHLGAPSKNVSFKVPNNGTAKSIQWSVTGRDKSRPIVLSQLAVQPGQQLSVMLENGGHRIKIENGGPDTSATMLVGSGTTDPVSVGVISIPVGESGQDCLWGGGAAPACKVMPLGTGSIFGFESSSAWTVPAQPPNLPPLAKLTTIATPRTEGRFALAVGGSGMREVWSQRFSTSILTGVTSSLTLDLYVPPVVSNPLLQGFVILIVDCPSAGIVHHLQWQVNLNGLPRGAYSSVRFPLNALAVAAMKGAHSDLSIGIALNTLVGPTPYVLDNLRFTP